jgi:hypothetical protein
MKLKRKLQEVAGDGYDGIRENGEFEVKTDDETTKFLKLSEAKKYYNSIKKPKAIWKTSGLPELLNLHEYVY